MGLSGKGEGKGWVSSRHPAVPVTLLLRGGTLSYSAIRVSLPEHGLVATVGLSAQSESSQLLSRDYVSFYNNNNKNFK